MISKKHIRVVSFYLAPFGGKIKDPLTHKIFTQIFEIV